MNKPNDQYKMKVNKNILFQQNIRFFIFYFLKKMLFGKNIWLVGEKFVMNVLQHFLIIIICVNNVDIWFVLNVQINFHN
jgi:hypothetical protein